MGNTASVALEPLHRLSGATPIVADDNDLWESLHSLELPSSSAEELQAASHAFCAEMVRNNTTSGNFRTLLRRTVDVLRQAQKPKAATAVLRQACGCVFLLRLYLKHMIETLEPAELAAHLSEPPATADATLLVAPLVTELRQSLVRVELKEDSYLLHMEAAAALTVCLSTQLFATLTDETPQPFVACTLSSSRADADALIATLLQHVLSQPPPPQPSTGLLRRLGRGMKSVLLLPYYSLTYLFYPTDDEAAPPALSDRAIQLLLLLTQHPPSTLLSPAADGTTPHNPFLDSLREMSDRQHEWPAASADSAADGDPESGQLRVASVPYRELHDAIASALPEQASALLLYLLLHGNRDYLDYSLSRTDPETILVPLLRVLHDSRSLPTNRLYMLLILLLMLSQVSMHQPAIATSTSPPAPPDLTTRRGRSRRTTASSPRANRPTCLLCRGTRRAFWVVSRSALFSSSSSSAPYKPTSPVHTTRTPMPPCPVHVVSAPPLGAPCSPPARVIVALQIRTHQLPRGSGERRTASAQAAPARRALPPFSHRFARA